MKMNRTYRWCSKQISGILVFYITSTLMKIPLYGMCMMIEEDAIFSYIDFDSLPIYDTYEEIDEAKEELHEGT